jgi:hypothetical protein
MLLCNLITKSFLLQIVENVDPRACFECIRRIFPSKDSEFSDSSADKGEGASRPTHVCASKRHVGAMVASYPQNDDSVDGFVIRPPNVKKPSSSKGSTKGGGLEKRGSVKMTVSKA